MNDTNQDISEYNNRQIQSDKAICDLLCTEITTNLPQATSKVWHGSPVWFLDGNPIVGYAVLKDSVQLLFWSGQSFDDSGLQAEGKYKAAQMRYATIEQINADDLRRWLAKSADVQWDYKNIVKRRGVLERLK